MFSNKNSLTFVFRGVKETVNCCKRSLIMASWQEEKQKYLSLNLDDKRKLYKCKTGYKTLNNIPTWKEYATKNQLANAVPLLANSEINKDLNAVLADKISVYRGDITTLEVSCEFNKRT